MSWFNSLEYPMICIWHKTMFVPGSPLSQKLEERNSRVSVLVQQRKTAYGSGDENADGNLETIPSY